MRIAITQGISGIASVINPHAIETSEQKHAEKNQPCTNNLSVSNP